MLKGQVIFWAVVLTAAVGPTVTAQTLNVMTEEFPPYNYLDAGKPVGISTDIVLEIEKRLGLPQKVTTLPWPRAYDQLQKEPGQVLYSMTLTDDRKPLFKWVGPLANFTTALYARKGNPLKITSYEDAKKVKVVMVPAGSPDEADLRKAGFTNLDPTIDTATMIKKMMAGHGDLFQGLEFGTQKTLLALGYKVDDLTQVYVTSKKALYIAFSLGTPDQVIQAWQKALDAMKADGTYEKIYQKYLKN